MTTDTLTEVLAHLRAHRGTWPTLATEAGVGYQWLTKLAQGRIKEPGYQKIARLHAAIQKSQAA